MRTKTISEIVHHTTLTAEEKLRDGGRALLLEAHDLIHTSKQKGQLVVDYGTGGSINSAIFHEREAIAQKDLLVETDDTDDPLSP